MSNAPTAPARTVEIDMMHRSPFTDCLHPGTRADCTLHTCGAPLAHWSRWFARVRTVAGNVTRRSVIAPDLAAALVKVRRDLKAGQSLVELRAGERDERHGWQAVGANLI